jgi:hypothetical protein
MGRKPMVKGAETVINAAALLYSWMRVTEARAIRKNRRKS